MEKNEKLKAEAIHKCSEIENDFDGTGFTTKIVGNTIEFDYEAFSMDSSFGCAAIIKFCPLCGKKLEPIEKSNPPLF